MKLADCLFVRDAVQDSEELFCLLQNEIAWREEPIKMFGKSMLQPRLLAWYGDANANYRYSGTTHSPLPWTPSLTRLKDQVEALTKSSFNSVLLNLYRDGNDSMGYHSDDEPELGRQPVIASLSFGAERRFNIKHKQTGELISFDLPHNSLFVMKGDFQRTWKHSIPKTKKKVGPRINLTFRQIVK